MILRIIVAQRLVVAQCVLSSLSRRFPPTPRAVAMSFVFLGGDGATRPTYFELLAAERLVPTLKAAITYSLSVIGQRRPLVARLLEYEEEICAVLLLLLDGHSLASGNATFSESLYGLRRIRQHDPAGSALPAEQRLLTLAVQVGLPYLLSKGAQFYTRFSPAPGVLGLAMSRISHPATQPLPPGAPRLDHLRRSALLLLLRLFPYAHAANEGAKFAYQALYMALGSAYFSPSLHLLGQQITRVSAQDMAAAEKGRREAWQRQLAWAALGSSAPARLVRRMSVNCLRGAADHGRNALILAVFGFKVLEWWFLSAEQKLAANQALPPPPPPPPPKPAADGVGLPSSIANCPVCQRPRTNAAQAAVSGYVFCYPCLFNYVMEHSRCPVSRLPMSLDHVRKLYDDP